MPQTHRQFWGRQQGRCILNHNWDAIDHDSVVLVTASEYVLTPNPQDEHPFIGNANVTVCNIAPHGPPYDPNHGVTFVVNVDWQSPLYIVTDITVLDEKPEWVGGR